MDTPLRRASWRIVTLWSVIPKTFLVLRAAV
jgi:hypothetical protein